MIQVERAYSEFGFSKGFSALSGCLQQYAADRLSTVGSLAVQSQLYQPQSDTTGGEFFDLGTVPVTRDYLARQVARSQVLARTPRRSRRLRKTPAMRPPIVRTCRPPRTGAIRSPK